MIEAIQNPLARIPLKIMPHDSASSIEKMIQSPPKTAPTKTSYISVTKNALKNPKTAPETSNHYLCKSICRTTISFKLKPGQNSKDFQLTIFEFVQPKKNMSLSVYNRVPYIIVTFKFCN